MSLLVADSLSASALVEFIQLRHPGNANSSAVFALARADENDPQLTLHELHKAASSGGNSAFVGDFVKKNGVMYLLAAMDVNLIMLSLMEEQNGRSVPFSQLLQVPGFPHYHKLSKCKALNLDVVADVDSSDPELMLVRLNEEKVVQFLLSKVDRMAQYLKENELAKMECGATASNFNGPSSTNSAATEAIRAMTISKEAERLAIQILGEYLPERWKQRLAETRNWSFKQISSTEPYKYENQAPASQFASQSEEESDEKRTVTWEEANGYAVQLPSVDHLRFGTKLRSTTVSGTVPPPSETPPPTEAGSASKRIKPSSVPMTSAQKKLAQVKDKRGVQSISAFFGKKAE